MGRADVKFLSLMPGENVILCTCPSALTYLWNYVFGVLLIPVLVGLVLILYAEINRRTTKFVVTNLRVVMRTGLLSVNQTEVRIADIRAVNLQRGLWQRLIGTGNVMIGTAATGGAEIVIVGIGNPDQAVSHINAQRK